MKLRCPRCNNVAFIEDSEFEQYYKHAKTFLCEKCECEFINPFANGFENKKPPQNNLTKKTVVDVINTIINAVFNIFISLISDVFCINYKNQKALFIGFISVISIFCSPIICAILLDTFLFKNTAFVSLLILLFCSFIVLRLFAAMIEKDYITYLNIENEKIKLLQLIQQQYYQK